MALVHTELGGGGGGGGGVQPQSTPLKVTISEAPYRIVL